MTTTETAMSTGLGGRIGPAGETGNKLHRLQREGSRNVPLCRLNDRYADGTPLEGRDETNVTCKTCRRILAGLGRGRR
jgi:hypothetical protein